MTATAPVRPTRDTAKIDEMNSLLRGELAAVETYEQAMKKFDKAEALQTLGRIRDDHKAAASCISSHILALGGVPDTDSGTWGTFARAVTGTAKALGPQTVLVALHEGEQHGIADYESSLQSPHLCRECLYFIRGELLPHCREHLLTLEQFMSEV
ncbi:hypothetical protein BH11PLA2_BH11PLA2_19580 [soil metagenome]